MADLTFVAATPPSESDTQAFLLSPQSYLENNLIAFTGANYAEGAGANSGNTFPWVAHGDVGQPTEDFLLMTQAANRTVHVAVYTDPQKIQFPGSKALSLRVLTGGADTGVRYLPWAAYKLTAMTLDPGANWFFTGPLQGCDIFIANNAGTVSVFHVNANDLKNEAENSQLKLGKAKIMAGIIGTTITHRLSWADYAPKDDSAYNGFVFGRLNHGTWQFYLHTFTVTKKSTATRYISARELPAV